MIPILFDADAKDFSTRGLGPLSDAKSCKVVEERNGTYELTMQYPKNGIHFEDIALNRIVLAIPSPYREPQPFRIYKISTPMRGVVTVNAQHISYDLSGVVVMPFSGSGVADILSQIKANSVNTNEFKFTGNSAAVVECNYITPHTARQILGGIEGSVIDRFGGEYEFDKFTVKWSLNRGANNGVTVKYGKNLLTLNQDVDISKIVTGVVPYWADTEGGSAVIGDRVDMDGEYSFEKIIPLDLSQEYQEQPTKEQLEARAKSYIDANYSLEPDINCTISFALIEQYEEYKDYKLLEKCDLCDIVTVQYPDLGVNSTAKIVKIDTNVLKERYNSVTIGTVRANIAQTIVAQQKAVENIPTRRDVAELVTGALGNITGAQGGAVRLLDTNNDGRPDTLYIADNPEPKLAKRVWRFNYLGWAASSNGYNGPFTLGATLEDGLLANFVTAANLKAGTIESADGGSTFFLDLVNGILRMKATSFSIGGKSVDSIAEDAAKNASEKALNDFVSGEFRNTIEDIEKQVDKRAETWYQTTDPSNSWQRDEWAEHIGDMWYNSSENVERTYRWDGTAWVEMKSQPPKDIFDKFDGKAQIFVDTPVPPYNIGDIWVQGPNGDILRCIVARENGAFDMQEWTLASKYTDNSALEAFMQGEFKQTIEDVKEQADQKAETWYQTSDPSNDWDVTQKSEHRGDLWFNSSADVQKYYRWNGKSWEELKTTPPPEVFDQIDGKAQVFVDEPKTPYRKGDLWFNSSTSDILTCITERIEGNFNSDDWVKRNKYTGDESLNDFISNVYDPKIEELQKQVDGQIETWFYDYDPDLNNYPANEWQTEAEKLNHQGDLFYNKTTGKSYRFFKDGDSWGWQLVVDSDVTLALQKASEAKDTADSKRRVFIDQPVPPYDAGDLWAQGKNGDIMRCTNSRQSGNYTPGDWEKASDYIDQNAANEASANAVREFVNGEYASTIKGLQGQLDKKAESWYQAADPSDAWISANEKALHKGDIWRIPGQETAKQWDGSKWIDMTTNPPKAVFDEIDGKAQIFASEPVPPYHKNDLWVQGESGDILRCIADREDGEYSQSDWVKASKYTDDTAANAAEAHAARNTAEIELTNKEIDLRATKNELGAVEGRLTQAEEKITDDSIVSTVRESQPYQDDLAKIAQTAHEIVMEVTLDKSEYITKANIFSTKNSKRGYLNEDGSFVENDNYLTTGYLPVKPKDRIFVQLWLEDPYPTVEVELVPEYENEILTYAGENQNYYRASSKNIIIGAVFYDAEKKFISSNIYKPSDTSKDYYCVETKFAPDNAVYVRGTSFYEDNSGPYWVQLYNNGTNMSDDIIEEVVEDPDYHSPREDMLTNLSSMISIDEKAIKFVADTLSWESKYSSLSNNGKLKCKDVEMSGKLIDEYKLYGYGFCVGEGNVPLFSYDDGYWSAIGKEGISFGYSEDLNNYGILNKDHPIKLNTLVSNPDGQIKYNPKAYGGATIFLDCYGINVKNENNEVYSGVTAEIPIITRIENNKNGGITWYYGWIRVVNGIIVDCWDGYT